MIDVISEMICLIKNKWVYIKKKRDEDPLRYSDSRNPPWLSTDDVAPFATRIENILGHLGRLT